jgi:hypothetical protein
MAGSTVPIPLADSTRINATEARVELSQYLVGKCSVYHAYAFWQAAQA